MKKIFIFFLTIICIGIAINTQNVYAESFHASEILENVRIKYIGDNGYIFNQPVNIVTRSSDEKLSYLIGPPVDFKDSSAYTEYSGSLYLNLANSFKKRAPYIAHFGYKYKNHTDKSWYVATQYLIYKARYPYNNFYITDDNDNDITETYRNKINEIESLITASKKEIDLDDTRSVLVGKDLVLEDHNSTLSTYNIISKNDNVNIENNKIIFSNVQEGPQCITISKSTKEELESSELTYYNNPKSYQDILVTGKVYDDEELTITVYGTTNSIKITKVDQDNNTTIPRGEAKLNGAKYGLYDEETNKLLQTTIIDNNMLGEFKNIDIGSYYIKEIEPGLGYTLNDEEIHFNQENETASQEFVVKNKVFEKTVTLHKEYGEKNNTHQEANIKFEIYNSKDILVKSIITDKNGNASIILPYGKYTVKQKNTKDGYSMVDDFIIRVNENRTNYYYKLYDYKLPEPIVPKEEIIEEQPKEDKPTIEKEIPIKPQDKVEETTVIIENSKEETIEIEVPNMGIKNNNKYILSILLLIPIKLLKKKHDN